MNKNIIIIGAGEAGVMLAREISLHFKNDYNILGFIDDDENKKSVLNMKVLGKIDETPNIVENYKFSNVRVDEIIIAIPSIDQKNLLKILNTVSLTNIKHKIVPGIFEIIRGNFSLRDVRNIKPSDLLGREEVGFDEDSLKEFYKDKTVLVTGGAGSIGSELVKQLITLPVKKVIALDISENGLHSLIICVNDKSKFEYIISNVCDELKIDKVMNKHKPEVIFHAAAHKHLPLMEEYPEEAIKNNILATNKISTLAIKNKIKNFVFISTDKAVRPTSLMGASKRICERIIMSLSHEQSETDFKITRFGNVLGSNGSVIPIFEKQIKEGRAITVTHPEMVRFFMSIREAARLVIKSCTLKNAIIFTLDMGKPVKILDLAKNMLMLYGLSEREIPIKFTGIREGEKLYEEILMEDETLVASNYKKLFSAKDTAKPLDKKEREKMVEAFRKAAMDADKASIKALMREYIEEYKG